MGIFEPKLVIMSEHAPKYFLSDGCPGPGDMTIASGSILLIELSVILSFRITTGSVCSSPKIWARLYTNES
jgi:hypothetical protein